MQHESQPDYPLLYSLRGFQYCDLLLSTAECAAWQMGNAEHGIPNAELVEACLAVSQRAAQTLTWVAEPNNVAILDIALNYLTLGRAALYVAILEPSAIRNSQSEIDTAVSGLRRAGTVEFLVRALLTRAWLRSLTGARTGPESAQSDLDEAWEIAERGPMRLHMADIHLHRARLFGVRSGESGVRSAESGVRSAEWGVRSEEEKYLWESPEADLAAAEK